VFRLKNLIRPVVVPDANAVVIADWLLNRPFLQTGVGDGGVEVSLTSSLGINDKSEKGSGDAGGAKCVWDIDDTISMSEILSWSGSFRGFIGALNVNRVPHGYTTGQAE
jgi:hypothetical protein